jgi:hypothetical protein
MGVIYPESDFRPEQAEIFTGIWPYFNVPAKDVKSPFVKKQGDFIKKGSYLPKLSESLDLAFSKPFS